MNFTLIFPSFDYLNSIEDNDETIILFDVIDSVFGQITINEDSEPCFWFDLVIDGFVGNTQWSRHFDKTREGYYELCNFAQGCYNVIFNNLINQNHDWQHDQENWEKNREV